MSRTPKKTFVSLPVLTCDHRRSLRIVSELLYGGDDGRGREVDGGGEENRKMRFSVCPLATARKLAGIYHETNCRNGRNIFAGAGRRRKK